jgi:hypothetical protein
MFMKAVGHVLLMVIVLVVYPDSALAKPWGGGSARTVKLAKNQSLAQNRSGQAMKSQRSSSYDRKEDNSSRGHRSRQDLSLMVDSAFYDFKFGSGATVGLITGDNLIFEASYMRASFSIFNAWKSEQTLYMARARWFTGNSFNLAAGIGLRKSLHSSRPILFTSSDSETSPSDTLSLADSTDDYEIRADHLVGELSIGNRWQFSAFTIGCDWIGFASPIRELSFKETAYNGQVSESDRNSSTADLNSSSLILTRFHLGFSF